MFAGSFLRALDFRPRPDPVRPRRAAVGRARARRRQPLRRRRRCLIFALLVPVLFYGNRYLLDLGIQILTYVMLGWGLNIVVGLAGLLDLGYVAFYAVGAYAYALIAPNFGLSFWICLPLAGILAAFWGILLGFPVLRLRGDYLAIVTLAFGEIIRLVLLNWQSLTGGPNGISGIARPSFLRHAVYRSGGGDLRRFSGSSFRRSTEWSSCSISFLPLRSSPTGSPCDYGGCRLDALGKPSAKTNSPADRWA